jgi:exopolysaccharide biosynthesis WecB/TagA/CpsF family protein
MTNGMPPSIEFLGRECHSLTQEQSVEIICHLAASSQFSYVVTPNVDHVVRFNRGHNEKIGCAYTAADLSLCDSRILASLARLSFLGLKVVTGSDLTAVLLNGGLPPCSIAVVGGDDLLHRSLREQFKGYNWSFHTPPMNVLADPIARSQIADFVEEASPSVTFFAIGAPQSEVVCCELKQRAKAQGVGLCIGASLEFLTGKKRRAPKWMQRIGAEWLFRLLSEPRRLWRRYMSDGPHIFVVWLRWLSNRRLVHLDV